MYRDDDKARADRANALIDEIADLERQKLAAATAEQRLETAKRELGELQGASPPVERRPGVVAHVAVFGACAAAAFIGYTLLF